MFAKGFLILALSFGAAKAVGLEPVPIYVQYAKTGRETPEQAEELGRQESQNLNPCVSQMIRELEKFAKTDNFQEAIQVVNRPDKNGPKLDPNLLLHYMNESMELRFELRPSSSGVSKKKEPLSRKPVYRKIAVISSRSGTWKDRLNGGLCSIPEATLSNLLEEMLGADRLAACKARKLQLIEASQKVSNYIHNYLPLSWIDEARRKLSRQRAEEAGILRVDLSVYRQGNETFRECAKGLKLLEEEAASSVRVLNEMKATKLNNEDMPLAEIEKLEQSLGDSSTAR